MNRRRFFAWIVALFSARKTVRAAVPAPSGKINVTEYWAPDGSCLRICGDPPNAVVYYTPPLSERPFVIIENELAFEDLEAHV